VAIWHAVEGDWQPPLSGPRDRFESTGTRVFRAANGSLSALPQGVSAGRDNWRLEAPEEVARPAFFLVRRLAEDADRGRRDDVADTLEELCVGAHEGALLQCARATCSAGTSYPVRARTRVPTHAGGERRHRGAGSAACLSARCVRAQTSAASSPLLTASWRAARVVSHSQGVGTRSSCSAETVAPARWSVAPLSMTKRATPSLSLGRRPGVSLAAWLPSTHR